METHGFSDDFPFKKRETRLCRLLSTLLYLAPPTHRDESLVSQARYTMWGVPEVGVPPKHSF